MTPTIPPWLCLALVFSVGLATRLPAQENLISNPGFETCRPVTIQENGPAPWAELLKRGVDLQPGEAVPLPVSWGPNLSDGWSKGHAASYRYITGQAGAEVYAGEHALFLAVKGSSISLVAGSAISVIENFTGTEKKKALPLKTPFPFSFYAKGHGTVSARLYTYPFGKENYGLFKVIPAQFTITAQWQKYQGTLEFTELGQFTEPGRTADSAATFVLTIGNGEVTLDEVTLYNKLSSVPQRK